MSSPLLGLPVSSLMITNICVKSGRNRSTRLNLYPEHKHTHIHFHILEDRYELIVTLIIIKLFYSLLYMMKININLTLTNFSKMYVCFQLSWNISLFRILDTNWTDGSTPKKSWRFGGKPYLNKHLWYTYNLLYKTSYQPKQIVMCQQNV